MGERVQARLAHPPQDLPERRVAGEVRADHQRVDEEADQVFEALVAASGDR
ncbi:hypothetical protein H4W34_000478 [Actinomadura algeriensis]|uniref:Uncharacterized protein n=1 Tax=Actinomadura algeriensis TaxID=1679523 RepID=A0ABR9JJB9_9ACTN|nr:hypothetical protein [Actinomadura algeriensis]